MWRRSSKKKRLPIKNVKRLVLKRNLMFLRTLHIKGGKRKGQTTRRGDLCVDKKHIKARTKTLFWKNRRQIFTPKFGKIGFQRKMSIFDRRPNAPPCDERSTQRNEERKECARHTAYKLHTELLKVKGPYTHAHKTDFCRRYVPTNATVKSMASQNKETMYIVDRGASLHMIGFSSVTCSDRQESTTRRLALLCRYIWRVVLRLRYCWEDHATSLVTLFVHGRQEELTDYP